MITESRHSKILLAAAIGLAAVASVVVALTAWAPSARQSSGATIPDDPRQIALGEDLYRTHCAVCHGAQLEGQPNWRTRMPNGRLPAPPHDETGHTWHHRDRDLFRIIKYGLTPPLAPEGYESDMPAFEQIQTDQEIWAVLAFIKSSWSPEIRARQSRRTSGVY